MLLSRAERERDSRANAPRNATGEMAGQQRSSNGRLFSPAFSPGHRFSALTSRADSLFEREIRISIYAPEFRGCGQPMHRGKKRPMVLHPLRSVPELRC